MRLALIASYIALSPVYWLPGISQTTVAQLKIAVVFVLLVTSADILRSINKTTALLIVALAATSLCSFISLGVSDTSLLSPAYRSIDFIEPILWIVVIASVPERDGVRLIHSVRFALIVFFMIALYPLAARLGIAPDIAVPDESIERLGESFSYLIGVRTVSAAGFNTGHTGWGPAVAFGCLALATILIHTKGRSLGEQRSAMAVLVMGTVCVVAVGARAASLALVVIVAIWFLSSSRTRVSLVLGAVLISALSFFVDFSALVPDRLLKMSAAGDIFSVLDDLSTGRLSTYVSGALDFVSSPLTGVGTDEARVVLRSGLEIVAIHNVWLRIAAEGGLVMLVPALWTMWLVVSAALKVPAEQTAAREISDGLPDFRHVIGFGLLLSFFEPSVIFGSFNNSVIFWTAVALAARPGVHPRAKASEPTIAAPRKLNVESDRAPAGL